jgi:hypothetical protein
VHALLAQAHRSTQHKAANPHLQKTRDTSLPYIATTQLHCRAAASGVVSPTAGCWPPAQVAKCAQSVITLARHISVEVKRIILLTCIRPIVEYGSEVWFPSTARQLQQIDKVHTDIIKCAMRCGKERPCSSILLAEWGVKPLHMWLHQRAMEFYFRV